MVKEIDHNAYTNTLRQIFAQEEEALSSKKLPIQREIPKEKELEPATTYPAMVQVGISNICNLRCKECYYPDYSNQPNFKPIYMNLPLYKKIVDETSNFSPNTVLRFLGRGESLTHPNAIEMISYAKNTLSGPVALISNGQLLNRRKAREILDTGIDVVDISMDAVTQETYSKVRDKSFTRLSENVMNMVEMRNQGNYSTKIMASFLIQPENHHEALNFRETWGKVVDKTIFRKYHSYGGKIPEKPCLPEDRHPCAALWNRVNINESGKITLCYIDWDETSIIADLEQQDTTIYKVWKESFTQARKGHVSGIYPELCKACTTGWQAAHWNLSYENAIKDLMQN